MKEFNFYRPESVDEASALLGEFEDEGASLLAGGTDLLVMMKHESFCPRRLIDIRSIPGLGKIRKEGEGYVIGATATLSEVAAHPGIKSDYPVLVQAVRTIASPQIRSQGTIGGNICLETKCLFLNRTREVRRSRPECLKEGGKICNIVRGAKRCFSIFSADSVPALMVLKARVKVWGPSGGKVIPIEEIYSGDGVKPFKLNREILTDVLLSSPSSRAVYLKNRWRRSLDFPIVGLAMAVIPDATGKKCEEVRIALTGVTGFPVKALGAESVFNNADISALMDKSLIAASAKEALKSSHPVSPMGGMGNYRRSQVEILLERAAGRLFEQIVKKEGEKVEAQGFSERKRDNTPA